MRNALLFILFSVFFVGFTNNVAAQSKESMKRQQFISKFMGAVSVNKKNKVIKLIDKEYISKYLDGKHKGNKLDFLAQFFAGIVVKSEEFSAVPFSKIFGIRLLEVNELQEGIAECKFILTTPEGDVETVLYLNSLKKPGKFAFVPKRR
jgi:hypothetical protein